MNAFVRRGTFRRWLWAAGAPTTWDFSPKIAVRLKILAQRPPVTLPRSVSCLFHSTLYLSTKRLLQIPCDRNESIQCLPPFLTCLPKTSPHIGGFHFWLRQRFPKQFGSNAVTFNNYLILSWLIVKLTHVCYFPVHLDLIQTFATYTIKHDPVVSTRKHQLNKRISHFIVIRAWLTE